MYHYSNHQLNSISWSLVLLFAGVFFASITVTSHARASNTLTTAAIQTEDELERQASWNFHDAQQVAQRTQQWLVNLDIDDAQKQAASTMLQTSLAQQLEPLDIVMSAITEVYPDWKPVIDQANQPRNPTAPIDINLIDNSERPQFAINHARLYVARWMVQNDFFDESVEQFAKLTTDDVLDPAALLFYKSIAQHGLMKKDECIESIERMLENQRHLPNRFVAVGKLMLADIKPLQEDSLDEISRLMKDIQRRQELYRSGKIVRNQEEEVLKKLDKMIEELEKKQQQQQMAASSNPSAPMQDSKNAGGIGPGKTDPKKIIEGGNWGNIPPEKRAEAMAEMTRDLPPHYRTIIEAYFRQLSRDENAGGK